MSRRRVSDCADIQTGFAFRAGLEADPGAPLGVVQIKDLGVDDIVDVGALDRIWMEVPGSRLLSRGDIVLRTRGDRTTGAIVATDPGLAIIAAPLLRLRVATGSVLPEYLVWALNQPAAQSSLTRHNEGSSIKMLRREAVEELEFEVPALERQRTIVELARLSVRERVLCSEIHATRGRLLTDVMTRYAEESEVQ